MVSEPFSIRFDDGRRSSVRGIPITEPDWARLTDPS
jgi:hypothetical protein